MSLCRRHAAALLVMLGACSFDTSGSVGESGPSITPDQQATAESGTDAPNDGSRVADAGPSDRNDLAVRDGPQAEQPGSDGPPAEATAPDLPVADTQPPDLPAADLSVSDLPAPDQLVPDLPVPDLPTPDQPVPDLPVPDLPLPDIMQPDAPPPDQTVGPLDTDNDGIPDFDDPCVNTPNPLLIDDPFNSNTGWTVYSGNWSLNNGDWRQSSLVDSSSAQHIYRNSFSEADIYVELDASLTQTTGTSYRYVGGAVHSLLPTGWQYIFYGIERVSSTSHQLFGFYRDANGSHGPYSSGTTNQGNGPYNIRASARGSTIKLWVSGQQANALTWTVNQPASGTVELMTQRATARFHHLRVYGIPSVCN